MVSIAASIQLAGSRAAGRLAIAILATSLTAVAACSSSAFAQSPSPTPPAIDQSLLPYASTKDSIRLPDGRMLHFVCMGRGSPAVILTTGSNGWSIGWSKVQPILATKTRVCAWDRAGFGLSDGTSEPQTVDRSATDLVDALNSGQITGPYVLVGVSMGGDESLLLKDREPAKVVGMVLVDPSFPDQVAYEQRAMSPALKAWGDAHPPPFLPLLKRCDAALRAGTLRPGGPDPDGCLHPPWPPDYPPELLAALEKHIAESTPAQLAATMEGSTSGARLNALNSKIVIKPNRNYGSMPIIVLTAEMGGPPGIPADLWSQAKVVLAEERRGHQEVAALSTQGVERVVTGASHDITSVKPQVVIDAINEVVDKARASEPTKAAH